MTAPQLALVLAAFGLMAQNQSTQAAIASVFGGTAVTMLALYRLSRDLGSSTNRTDDVGAVVVALGLGLSVFGLITALFGATIEPFLVAVVLIGSAVGLLVVRGILRQLRGTWSVRRVIIVGTGPDAEEISGLLADHPEAKLHLVGVVGNEITARRGGLSATYLGDMSDLAEVLARHEIDVAVVTATGFRSDQFRQTLGVLRTAGVEPMLTTGVTRLDTAALRLTSVAHEPLLAINWPNVGPTFHRIKRVLDILGALIGLLAMTPLMLVVALAIKLEDRGPVLYRSRRVGKGMAEFDMLKFRSMTVDADDQKNDLAQRNERSGPLFKVSNDPRVTGVGKRLRMTSIDEIPQLLNVLMGQMSLVGPRPALPEEARAFDHELLDRFSVVPGVTGLWQVEARSNASFATYRRLDLHYLANRSLKLDAEILVATVVQVVVSVLMMPVAAVMKGRGILLASNPDTIHLPAADAVVADLRDYSGPSKVDDQQGVSGL